MFYFHYLAYIIRHKKFVWQAGRLLGLGRWQLLIHDWQKFLPVEFFAYADWFYGPYSRQARGKIYNKLEHEFVCKAAFDRAWLHHQNSCPHHWQYWIIVYDQELPQMKALEMPERFALEMLADWTGAGLAITGKNDLHTWYEDNRNKIILHERTRAYVENEMGYSHVVADQK